MYNACGNDKKIIKYFLELQTKNMLIFGSKTEYFSMLNFPEVGWPKNVRVKI